MAFDRTSSKFERLAGGNHQLFYYTTADAYATVVGAGYFNSITNELRAGDVIICLSGAPATPMVDLLYVTSGTGAALVSVASTEGNSAT